MSIIKKQYLIFSLLLVLSVLLGTTVKADGQLGSTHTQDLVIVKYGLNKNSNSFSESQTTNTGEKINNIPIDNNGNQLKPLAGVQYSIQKIEPTDDGNKVNLSNGSTYRKVGSSQTIVTGADGVASLVLSDGFYIVSELANKSIRLTTPATPVLLRPPVVNELNNGYLDTVYIYPKSSIDPVKVTPVKVTPVPKKTRPGVLPKTGEQLNFDLTIVGLVALLIALSLMVVKVRKRGKK